MGCPVLLSVGLHTSAARNGNDLGIIPKFLHINYHAVNPHVLKSQHRGCITVFFEDATQNKNERKVGGTAE